MASSTFTIIAIIASLLFSSTMGHSQMRCAKYNKSTGTCDAPIRNQVNSFLQEAYTMNPGQAICQSPMSNPISASYANGAGCPSWAGCPSPMGSYNPGENFTVMWFARNHAVADQTPGDIALYLSPPQSQTQGADATLAQFQQNRFCVAPYSSCNRQNGDTVQCTTTCTMPVNTTPGIYTLWWKWQWTLGSGSAYSTCADILVVAKDSSSPSTVPVPAPVPTPVAPTPVAPTPVAPTPVAPTPVAPVVPTPAPVAPTPAPVVPTPAPVVPTPVPVVTPSPAPVTTPTDSCTGNTMKCLSDSTYSMCNRGSWGSAQSCGPRTQCSAVGEYIYCVAPKTPAVTPSPATVPAPTPATVPVPAPAPVPVTPSSSSTSTSSSSTPASTPATGSCTIGYQLCFGDNMYQTCGNGRSGPEWAAPQACRSGLSCHSSATANNIYCY